MVGHLLDYYNKHGGGAQKREERIQEEVERQLALLERRQALELDDVYDEDEGATVYGLDDVELRHLRLSDDGELTGIDDPDDYSNPKKTMQQSEE